MNASGSRLRAEGAAPASCEVRAIIGPPQLLRTGEGAHHRLLLFSKQIDVGALKALCDTSEFLALCFGLFAFVWARLALLGRAAGLGLGLLGPVWACLGVLWLDCTCLGPSGPVRTGGWFGLRLVWARLGLFGSGRGFRCV